MNEQKLVQMTDILPLPEASEISSVVWVFIMGALVVIFAGIMLWNISRSPLIRISRQLKNDTISTRSASHQLAQYIKHSKRIEDQEVQDKLDLMRFQRKHPDKDQLLRLIKWIKQHA